MDPATIVALATATKATVDAIRSVLEKGKGREAEKAAREALNLVADLNTRLLQLQEMAFRLSQEKAEAIEENTKLRAQISQKEERAAERDMYERKSVNDVEVWVREGAPKTFYCPKCVESKGHHLALTVIDDNEYSHMCFTCHTPFALKK